MTDPRRTFSRKARARLDTDERARLIAELAEAGAELAAETFDLPRVDQPEPVSEPEPEPESAPEADLAPAPGADPETAAPEVTDQPAMSDPALSGPAMSDPEQPAAAVAADASRETARNSTDAPKSDRPAPAETGQQPEAAPPSEQVWANLATIPVDPAHLERNLIITAGRHDPAHGAFDVLRTRLVHVLHENGWKRVAVTSPTRDCGKTFTSVNLAISLSRYETNRTVLMDMDMRNPSVASVLGVENPGSMGDFLQGQVTPAQHFRRLGRNALNIGANLAVGLNDRAEPYAAELIQDPLADAAFERMMDWLDPDIVLYDLPPALAFDDVIAFRKHFDGVLMVVGGGTTTADEIREAMRRIGEDVPLLGVVLNQAEGESRMGYTYGY